MIVVRLMMRAIIGLLAGVAALTACESPVSPPSKPFAIKSSDLTQTASNILLNTNSARRDAVAANNAMQLLIGDCIRSHKLAYYPQLLSEPSTARQALNLQEFPPYGSLQERRRDGYGLAAATATAASEQFSGAKATDAQDHYLGRLAQSAKENYEQIEYGPSSDLVYLKLPGGVITLRSGGCRGWAAVQIFGSIRNYLLSVSGQPRYFDQFLQMVDSSAQVTRALRDWSTCIAKSGFHYATPEDAYFAISRKYLDDAPREAERAREIAVAVADYQCASQVSLIPITLKTQRELAAHLARTALSPVLEIAQIDIYAAHTAARIWQPGH